MKDNNNERKQNEGMVMVVEDVDDLREMLRHALEVNGYSVVEAANGWVAVGLANHVRPDLILMDLHLPALDGFEATCLLRENDEFRDLPIVAVTAHDSSDARADAAEVGCDQYVTKPIDLDHLEPLIDRLLNKN